MGDKMTYHNTRDFADAIEATAQYFNMNPVFIEKDYWVTFVLKNLSNSSERTKTVFKGETSLSKVYNCIHRFSEDVDLAIISKPGQSQQQIKDQMKAVEKASSIGLTLLEDPPPVKRGKNRFSNYRYRTIFSEGYLVVAPYIRLEISAFTNPAPYEEAGIQSYVGKYLTENDFHKDVIKYGLEAFNINVLSIERTFVEKTLSLIRSSYKGIDLLKEKIRHYHDLALLLNEERIKKMLSEKNHTILDSAYRDDKSNTTFQGEWTTKPFNEAPLFSHFDDIWGNIRTTYHSELRELSWAEKIPSDEEIIIAFTKLKEFVLGYNNVDSDKII